VGISGVQVTLVETQSSVPFPSAQGVSSLQYTFFSYPKIHAVDIDP
jgi:hypothetical protein